MTVLLYDDALTVFDAAPRIEPAHGRLLLAAHAQLEDLVTSDKVEQSPGGILPPEHPLATTFSVGPDARQEVRDAAAEVLGFSLGQRVRCLFRPHEGHRATVVRLNPADREIGVVVDRLNRVLWCVASELAKASDIAYKAPRRRSNPRKVHRDGTVAS